MFKVFMYFFIFIIGASIGSFLNVLIDRLPRGESIMGRSHCDHCQKKIAWYDLIPILSFIFLGGKSRCCNKKLSLQYPLVEAITGISFFEIFNFQFPIFIEFSISNFQFFKLLSLWGIISCLIVIFFSDLKYHLISDWVLLALFVFSLLYKVWTPSFDGVTKGIMGVTNWVIPAQAGIQSIISGLIVASPIFLIYYISHERAMGLGDVYLSAIMGFLLGWKDGFIALYIAFVTGAIFGLGLIILHRKKFRSKIPFGPFLVTGTIIMLFWGEKIFDIIKRIYGF